MSSSDTTHVIDTRLTVKPPNLQLYITLHNIGAKVFSLCGSKSILGGQRGCWHEVAKAAGKVKRRHVDSEAEQCGVCISREREHYQRSIYQP